MLCAAGVATLALAEGADVSLAVGIRLAALALLALVAAVVLGWSVLVPVALVLLGSAYATRLAVDDVGLDARAPMLAAGLLLTAELGYWSIEEQQRVRGEQGDDLRHLAVVAVLTLAGLTVALVVLAVADLARTRGLAVDLLGAAAAAAALLVIVLMARRQGQTGS